MMLIYCPEYYADVLIEKFGPPKEKQEGVIYWGWKAFSFGDVEEMKRFGVFNKIQKKWDDFRRNN